MQPDPDRRTDRPSVLLLILLGTALGFAESFLPRPLPFVKPGFANTAGVIAAATLGMSGTLRVNVTRAFAVALASGTIATPSFALSLAGAVAASLAMGAAGRAIPRFLSVTALSVLGSAANMAAQLAAASVIIPGLPVRSLIAPAAIWSLASGVLVGAVSVPLLRSGLLRESGLVREPEQG